MHRHHIGRTADAGEHLKILQRIVRRVGIQRGIHRERGAGDQQRVTVARGFGGKADADIRARAGTVIDHHGLAETLGELARQNARDHVGGAAGSKGHDDAQRLGGVGLS